MENHYATLGVAESATDDEIKKAYRKLASANHPDKGGDTEKFKIIQTAYDVIGDKNKRGSYDSMRSNPGGADGFRFNTSNMDGQFPPGMEDILRGFGFGFNGGRQQPQRNKDIQVRVVLDLSETLSKQAKIVNVKTGNGDVSTVTIDIPRGVHSGSTVKYPGLGDNRVTTLPRGDLYVQVVVNQHDFFQVHGNDLVAPLEIDALHAIIGSKQVIKVLDGTEFELTIPAGIQATTKFKLAQQGLYYHQQDHRGDLYLIAQIKVPTNLSATQLATIKQIIQ